MDALLARLTQGIDLASPDASWQLLQRVWLLVPWMELFWWNLLFVLVGAALGWWCRRLWEGVAWALLLGPIGWLVVVWRKRPAEGGQPPPLPPRR